MTKIQQTDSGKAFEYAIAQSISKITRAKLVKNSALDVAFAAYNKYTDDKRLWIERAANESCAFLCRHDKRFEKATSISLQDDKIGVKGDVRDVIISIPKCEIGISAKHQHKAIKHSRLSDKIDFGKEWTEYPCSPKYMEDIKPVFKSMRREKALGTLFRDVDDKESRYYLPVLTAFEDELGRLCEEFGRVFVKRLFRYLLGKYDFYKVMRDKKTVSIQSVNMDGTLEWGRRWKIPDRIDSIVRKRESRNTLLVSFTGGWQISFRLHNASSRVEPSLKFDIQFVGMPQDVARHEIRLDV